MARRPTRLAQNVLSALDQVQAVAVVQVILELAVLRAREVLQVLLELAARRVREVPLVLLAILGECFRVALARAQLVRSRKKHFKAVQESSNARPVRTRMVTTQAILGSARVATTCSRSTKR